MSIKKQKGTREKITVSLDPKLVKQAKAAAYWCRLPLSQLMERAMKKEIRELQRKYNDGEEFDTRRVKLSAGRPVKHI